jgi:TetR/AcrR family transcriptional repressor of bet genes
MSPGIVRFYFDSKAAMLVASLQFLAAEFEERLLVPVAKLKATPVAALERLVQLYLDPDIASPRKVSVWYAYWGEANSRQEYYDICGQKDEGFAALVRELIGRLILDTAQSQLDADGIALGLIGVLEMLWQEFAFRTEETIDRAAARRRCRAYLRSIFPTRFAAEGGTGTGTGRGARAYADPRLHGRERELLFQNSWTVVAHESQLVHAGDFLTVDLGVERAMLVRDAAGTLRGLRNACPAFPHTLVTRRAGRFDGDIVCELHGHTFSWDGRHAGGLRPANLHSLELISAAGLLYARAARDAGFEDPGTDNPGTDNPGTDNPGTDNRGSENGVAPAIPATSFGTELPAGLTLLGEPLEMIVAADWKVVIEQWLAMADRQRAEPVGAEEAGLIGWHALPLRRGGWSERRYLKLMRCTVQYPWHLKFIPPNQLLELRPDGLSVLQALPLGAARCRVRRMDLTVLSPDDGARAVRFLAHRLAPYARHSMRDVAESVQSGVVELGYEAATDAAPASLVSWFRDWYGQRM